MIPPISGWRRKSEKSDKTCFCGACQVLAQSWRQSSPRISKYEQNKEPQGSHFNEVGSQAYPPPHSNHGTMGHNSTGLENHPPRPLPPERQKFTLKLPIVSPTDFPDCISAFVEVAACYWVALQTPRKRSLILWETHNICALSSSSCHTLCCSQDWLPYPTFWKERGV